MVHMNIAVSLCTVLQYAAARTNVYINKKDLGTEVE